MIIGSSYPVAFSYAQEAPSLNQNDCRDDASIDNLSQSRFNIMDSKLDSRKVSVEEDLSTLLDAFGELAKDIVTHHIVSFTCVFVCEKHRNIPQSVIYTKNSKRFFMTFSFYGTLILFHHPPFDHA
jgi:hypothetical protein